jgi:DnaK suppressor protein
VRMPNKKLARKATVPAKAGGSVRSDTLRQMLLERRQEVMKAVEGLLTRRRMAQAEQRDDAVADTADMALQDADGDQQIALMEMRNRMREQIDEALLRLDEGTYGICEDCGREITERRLKAIPFARRCVECQEKAEALDQLEQEKDQRQI